MIPSWKKGKPTLTALESWISYLNNEYSLAAAGRSPSPPGSKKRKRDGTEHVDGVERVDLLALEDAVGRVRAAVAAAAGDVVDAAV